MTARFGADKTPMGRLMMSADACAADGLAALAANRRAVRAHDERTSAGPRFGIRRCNRSGRSPTSDAGCARDRSDRRIGLYRHAIAG